MNHFCDKPDRDVPKLVCGYPIPCPYHTVVLTEADLKAQHTLANLRWMHGRVFISTYFSVGIVPVASAATENPTGIPVVRIRTVVCWTKDRTTDVPVTGTHEIKTDLPIDASPTEIRNATEEQQITARAWLEEHYATPAHPIADSHIAAAVVEALQFAPDTRDSAGVKYAQGYLPGCRRPAHRDGQACDGGCTEIVDPVEWRAARVRARELEQVDPPPPRKRRGGTKGQRYKNKR